MRRQIFGTSLLILVLAFSFLPPFLANNARTLPRIDKNYIPLPQTDLNATGFSIRYHYDSSTGKGNSSLLDVIVQRVNASDIGECAWGDLSVHVFRVYNGTGDVLVFTDNLAYNGSMWVALNYSLLIHTNMSTSYFYYVECYFERNLWNTTTDHSDSFLYEHQLHLPTPVFTYIADTSHTIDIFVNNITSSLWGKLITITSTTLVFHETQNHSAITDFVNKLVYNASADYWEVNELNISSFTPEVEYEFRVVATYNEKPPIHVGNSPWSSAFRYLAPFLVISRPEISYIGRSFQLLNISVSSVWDSIFGYLTNDNITIANFSIYHINDDATLINGSLLWNATGTYWYFWNFDLIPYITLGNLTVGEYYNVSAFFYSPTIGSRPAVNATSNFSFSFLIDRDPPVVINSSNTPDPPTDIDQVIITCEISDDALIGIAILSYYNGSHWVNMTMRGAGEKIANFTAVLPVFPERFLMSYRIYVNDSQDAWTTSSLFSYTVTDTPPLIAFVNYSPSSPTDRDGVTISVNVTDGTAVQTVTLYYSFGGGFVSVEMEHIAGNLYQAQVPAFPGSFANFQFQSVIFRIEAKDIYDNVRISSDYAYLVRGTAFGIDPFFSLFIVVVVGLIIIVLIILLKIYEQY